MAGVNFFLIDSELRIPHIKKNVNAFVFDKIFNNLIVLELDHNFFRFLRIISMSSDK